MDAQNDELDLGKCHLYTSHDVKLPGDRQRQVRNDQVAKVIIQLEELKPRLATAAAKAADETIEYYQNNQKRMKYTQGRKCKEPVGSGAIESTCRQLQCRMKRCGQFWTKRGLRNLCALDEARRNHHWDQLWCQN